MLTDQDLPQLNHEATVAPEISFDLEAATVQGSYSDELSAYRAKKVWIEALENHFLLDEKSDYLISVQPKTDQEELKFQLYCHFTSACARYAFWRMTNNQAPEAEYTLETAHIPASQDAWLNFQTSSDAFIEDHVEEGAPFIFDHRNHEVKLNKGWFDSFETILQKLVTTFDSSEKSDKPEKKD